MDAEHHPRIIVELMPGLPMAEPLPGRVEEFLERLERAVAAAFATERPGLPCGCITPGAEDDTP